MLTHYRDRYQRLKTRRAKDWWTATFGDPLSWVLLAGVADWKILTPNGLTGAAFVTKLAASGLIAFGSRGAAITGALLLQVGVLLDHMDGNLARYRGIPSLKGGFLDRILDGISVLALFSALSWQVYGQGAPAYTLLMGPVTAGFYLVICYMYWSFAYYEQQVRGKPSHIKPGAHVRDLKSVSTGRIILEGQKKIFNFHHIDYYFWISLGIIGGFSLWILWILFIVVGGKVAERFFTRIRNLERLDSDSGM